MSECDHIYHSECMKSYLQSEISSSKCPLICPDTQCKVEMVTVDLKKVLTEEEIDKFYDYSFLKAISTQKDIFWCPTPNCNYAFSIENLNAKVKEYVCEKCEKHYCLNCHVPFHKGLSCK